MAIDAPPQIDALPEPRPDRFGGAQFDNEMQAWLSQFPIWTDQHEALGQWSYATALEVASLAAVATGAAGTATTKAGQAAASATAAQGYSDTTLGYKNEANAHKVAAAGSATAANTSAGIATTKAAEAAASAASIAGGPVASLVDLTGAITQTQFNTTVAPGLPVSTAQAAADTAVLNAAAADATAKANARYGKNNILASVSQVGGVPTGGIIETVTNANGTATRFASGLQVCTQTRSVYGPLLAHGALFTNDSTLWIFPWAFARVPFVGVGEVGGNGMVWSGLGSGATEPSSTTFQLFKAAAATTSSQVTLSAVGYWY